MGRDRPGIGVTSRQIKALKDVGDQIALSQGQLMRLDQPQRTAAGGDLFVYGEHHEYKIDRDGRIQVREHAWRNLVVDRAADE